MTLEERLEALEKEAAANRQEIKRLNLQLITLQTDCNVERKNITLLLKALYEAL